MSTTISIHDHLADRIEAMRGKGDKDFTRFVVESLYQHLGPYEAVRRDDGKYDVIGADDVTFAFGLTKQSAQRYARRLNLSLRAHAALVELRDAMGLNEDGREETLAAIQASYEVERALVSRYRTLDEIQADAAAAREDSDV
jgi:hypothetical protein